MSERNFFKERATNIFSAIRIPWTKIPPKDFIYAGIQLHAGGFLATYTMESPTDTFLPYMCSAIAIGGIYNIYKSKLKDYHKPSRLRKDRIWDIVSGVATYSTGIYMFSKGLKDNDKMWIPCLALAASGYYFTTSAVNSVLVLNRNTFLKCCQLMYGPTLVTCAATYLFYFRNHNEGWLKCLPFLAIGATGLKIIDRGVRREGRIQRILLRLKVTEMFFGGCFLSVSCTVLAIYSSVNDFFWPCTVFMSVVSLYGGFVTLGSLILLRLYIDMDTRVFTAAIGMIVGPVIFSSAFLSEFVEKNDAMYIAFPFLTGIGQAIVFASIYHLYKRVPRKEFLRYNQRVFGPILALYSSVISAYVVYHLGWRFSILTIPFIPAGIYATYRGFRKDQRTSTPS